MPTSRRVSPLIKRVLAPLGLEQLGRSIWARIRGFQHQCPMCLAHLKTFLPGGEHHAILTEKLIVGGGWRSSVSCPNCGSFDRERLAYLYLKNRPHLLSRSTKVLHVAPEPNLSFWLRSKVELDYVSADLSGDDVDLNFDLARIPFADSTFNAIICNHVFEHIPNDRRAMAELFRVLKPGGWAMLQVPISLCLTATYEDFSITDPMDRERAFGQNDHVRIYAMDYVDRLKQTGFAIELFHWRENNRDYGGKNNRYGLIDREIVFFASRPDHAVVALEAMRPALVIKIPIHVRRPEPRGQEYVLARTDPAGMTTELVLSELNVAALPRLALQVSHRIDANKSLGAGIVARLGAPIADIQMNADLAGEQILLRVIDHWGGELDYSLAPPSARLFAENVEWADRAESRTRQ
jgi:predicted SAM-dependent methyltransferase